MWIVPCSATFLWHMYLGIAQAVTTLPWLSKTHDVLRGHHICGSLPEDPTEDNQREENVPQRLREALEPGESRGSTEF
jgi:hypothetical protein